MEEDLLLLSKVKANDPSITSLELSKSKIGRNIQLVSELTTSLEENTYVKRLDLSHCKITENAKKYLPQIIEKNKSITYLDLSQNNLSTDCITKLSYVIQQNYMLQEVILCEGSSSSAFSSKPVVSSALMLITRSTAQNLQIHRCMIGEDSSISLSNRNLLSIPSIIYNVPSVVELDLSSNQLKRIPSELYSLKSLERLNLSDNFIEHIEPCGITQLENLKYLNLENNLLSSLPFGMGQLPIEELLLSKNLFVSPICFPKNAFFSKGLAKNYEGKLHMDINNVNFNSTRLFFLGSRESRIFEYIFLIKNWQLSIEPYKSLSTEERNVLSSSIRPVNNFPELQIHYWFPTIDKNEKPKGVKHRLVHRISSMELSDQAFSFAGGAVPPFLGEKSVSTVETPREKPKGRSRRVTRSGAGSSIFLKSRDETVSDDSFCHISCFIFDSVSLQLRELLIEGDSNNVPLVVSFQLTNNIAEMKTKVLRLLYTLPVHKESIPPLFIVASYQTLENPKKWANKVKKAIEARFPHLVFSYYIVCTQNGQGIKQLASSIIKEISIQVSSGISFPWLDSSVGEWISSARNRVALFIEKLCTLKEEISNISDEWLRIAKSVLNWREFKELASASGLVDSDLDRLALYARHLGLIQHYKDVNWEGRCLSNLIFLNSEVIFKSFSMIVRCFNMIDHRVHERSELCGISITRLKVVWGIIPEGLHKPLLKLFRYSGQVYPLDEKYFIVPSIFVPPPKNLYFDKPPNPIEYRDPCSVPYIARRFRMIDMSEEQYSKLVCAIHKRVVSASLPIGDLFMKVYRYMIEIELTGYGTSPFRTFEENEEIPDTRKSGNCLITFDYERSCICLYVTEEDARGPLFCWIVGELEQYLESEPTFSKHNTQALCVCSSCRTLSLETCFYAECWISMDHIEKIVSEGHAFYYCNQSPVRIDLLAPDISLSNLEHMLVEYSSIKIIKKVGDGGFASVYYGVLDDQEIAVKELDKSDSLEESFPEFRREVSLMAGLHHPNTCGLIGLCKQPFCVLTEFCAYGDLFSYIQSRAQRNIPLPESYIMDALLDIAKGMKFLHTTTPPIVHRDLKSPNILICRIAKDEETLENPFPAPNFLIEGHQPSKQTAKVADFGLSMKTHGPLIERVVDNPIWLAPELLDKKPYSCASDVYAFGIIMNEMYSLAIPYDKLEYQFTFQLEEKIVAGARPEIPESVPEKMKTLISNCWHADIKARPTFAEVISILEEHNLLLQSPQQESKNKKK